MKFFLIILICVVTKLPSKAQSVLPLFFYNGIDTIILGDKKTKYINANNNKIFKHFQTDTLKGQVINRYGYIKDSLFAYKIDTITFRSLVLSFSDSILAEINFFKSYDVKDIKVSKNYLKNRIEYLKKYISDQLHKKGKFKKYYRTDTFFWYGYEWKKGDYIIKLAIQYDLRQSKYIFIDIYMTNVKWSDYM